MKKIFALILALIMIVSLFGCAQQESVETEPTETQAELELLNPTEPEEEEKIESKSWIGLVLIAGVLLMKTPAKKYLLEQFS